MGSTASPNKGGTTFRPRLPVVVMAPDSATAGASQSSTDKLLHSLISGERGRALRAQLAARHPGSSADAVEEAIQYACKSFLDEAQGITAPGQVYAWVRTAAHRSLNREADRDHRAVHLSEDELEELATEETSPVEELIELEDDADLEMLVAEVSASLSDRQRNVFALYGAGYKRPQIADRLGVRERVVKRDLLEIMDQARATLARLAGGGCEQGESLVLRSVCGISTPDESAKAREHVSDCGRCELFSERLIAWRDKAGAVLPPTAEGASPGVVRHFAEASGEKLSAIKQHVLDGGAQVKQHATATYYRAVDPTPLAAARPGTAAAVIASCIAIGGGAATYCVEQGVNPIGAAKGLIASGPPEEQQQPQPTTTTTEPESTGPKYTPAETPVVVEEPPPPAPEPEPQPAPQPQPKPQPEPEPPPPEDSYEPVSPAYQSSETESESSYEETSEAPPVTPEPAPAPPSAGPQFGGP
jgi:RNA polymerase sigma factor (sigma-70 family)